LQLLRHGTDPSEIGERFARAALLLKVGVAGFAEYNVLVVGCYSIFIEKDASVVSRSMPQEKSKGMLTPTGTARRFNGS